MKSKRFLSQKIDPAGPFAGWWKITDDQSGEVLAYVPSEEMADLFCETLDQRFS